MNRPARVGELLPRAAEAWGVREKLAAYVLNLEHEDGGPKARGFALILGIGLEQIDHLEAEIRAGVLTEPVVSIDDNAPYGITCAVDVTVRGIADGRGRTQTVRTVWELTDAHPTPRLISAYPYRR